MEFYDSARLYFDLDKSARPHCFMITLQSAPSFPASNSGRWPIQAPGHLRTPRIGTKLNRPEERIRREANLSEETVSSGLWPGSLASHPDSNLNNDSETKKKVVIIVELERIKSSAVVIDGI